MSHLLLLMLKMKTAVPTCATSELCLQLLGALLRLGLQTDMEGFVKDIPIIQFGIFCREWVAYGMRNVVLSLEVVKHLIQLSS